MFDQADQLLSNVRRSRSVGAERPDCQMANASEIEHLNQLRLGQLSEFLARCWLRQRSSTAAHTVDDLLSSSRFCMGVRLHRRTRLYSCHNNSHCLPLIVYGTSPLQNAKCPSGLPH